MVEGGRALVFHAIYILLILFSRLQRPGVVMEALRQEVSALQFAAQRLRDDRELMLLAVRRDGQALRFCSARLRGDVELVIEAVKQDGRAIVHGAPEVRGSRQLQKEMQGHGEVLRFLGYDSRQRVRNEEDLFDSYMGHSRAGEACFRDLFCSISRHFQVPKRLRRRFLEGRSEAEAAGRRPTTMTPSRQRCKRTADAKDLDSSLFPWAFRGPQRQRQVVFGGFGH